MSRHNERVAIVPLVPQEATCFVTATLSAALWDVMLKVDNIGAMYSAQYTSNK